MTNNKQYLICIGIIKQKRDIPVCLSHKSIVSVNYEKQDAYTNDVKFLSIGKSIWNEDDISAKIWCKDNNDRWS